MVKLKGLQDNNVMERKIKVIIIINDIRARQNLLLNFIIKIYIKFTLILLI